MDFDIYLVVVYGYAEHNQTKPWDYLYILLTRSNEILKKKGGVQWCAMLRMDLQRYEQTDNPNTKCHCQPMGGGGIQILL